MLDQINQNPYFGCFEILSLFFGILFLFPIIVSGVLFSLLLLFWDIISFSYYCFGILFLFPIIVLGYFFLSYYLFWGIFFFPIICFGI